jgi:glycosyltransferase involved in cell wall biosynthesis
VPNTHTGHAVEVVAAELRRLGLELPSGDSHRPNPSRLAREEREYELADVLLVPSDYVRQTFLDRSFPAEQLGLHQYGFDPKRFLPPKDLGREGGLRAVFVGSCDTRKGLHLALRAWHDAGLTATGRFQICGAFEPSFRSHVAPLLDHSSVEVLGSRSDVPDILRDNDVLLLPSIEEGSALVTYEAMASGCAVVASFATGTRATHDVSGLLHEPGDVSTLTGHLRTLDGDAELLQRLRRGAVDASRNLTWQHAGERVLELYRELLTRSD